jgi:phospholipid/cholesterol/gamma-HCH transport system permease protein
MSRGTLNHPPETPSPVRRNDASERTIALPEHFTRQWIEANRDHFLRLDASIRLDFTQTRTIDSAAAALLTRVDREMTLCGHRLVLQNISQELLTVIEKWTAKLSGHQATTRPGEGWLAGLGSSAVALGQELTKAFSILSEMLYWSTIGMVGRRGFRKGSVGVQMYQLGFKALGIVGLLSLLIGVVLALQTAIQLRTFGADIFLAPMIGISMIRELGPLMTAIILAGRTGSATTAEIATMNVQEELDALQTMSINPIQFVVVPKFWAITLTMPLLSIIAVACGILGGFLVAILYLETSASLFLNELAKSITLKDFMAGFIKSVVFSWLIIWIGTYYGFKVKGGAEEVGKETTASVVSGIFVIIIADAIFSFII